MVYPDDVSQRLYRLLEACAIGGLPETELSEVWEWDANVLNIAIQDGFMTKKSHISKDGFPITWFSLTSKGFRWLDGWKVARARRPLTWLRSHGVAVVATIGAVAAVISAFLAIVEFISD